MKLIILWSAVALVFLIVVGETWVAKGGYANEKRENLFFLTAAVAFVGLAVSLGIAIFLGA